MLVGVVRFPVVGFRGWANRDLQGMSFRKLNRSEARTARSRLNRPGFAPPLRETSYRNPFSTSEWEKHSRSLAAMKVQRGNSPGSLKSNLPSYRQRNCNATAPFSIKPGSCRYTAIIEPFFNHVQGGELA